MQNIFLALAILVLTTITGNGQCHRKINWKAAKAELLDEKGQVIDTKKGAIVMSTDKSTLSLTIKDAPSQSMEGTIKDISCNWQHAFKEGKTVYIADMHHANSSDKSHGTFTIEARDGKITILMELEKLEGKKIRIPVEKYEEADNDLPVPRTIIDISTI
jgi:hypothetical protein